MLLRHRPAPRSLSLPHLNISQPSHLPLRHNSVHASQGRSLSNRQLSVTRPKSALWDRKKTAPASLYAPGTHRPLATAVDDSIHQSYTQPPSPIPLYHIRAFDPTKALHVKVQDDTPVRSRLSPQGIPGGIDEMISVFDACLEVNKLERAATVLARFKNKEGLPQTDLIALHNQYLRAGIDRALDQPKSRWADSLHEWFEVEIRGKDIPHTPETIACMLKISLLSTQGPRLHRVVVRYLDMLPAESIWSVLGSNILNQQDIGTITSIYQPLSSLPLSNLTTDHSKPSIESDIEEEIPLAETSSSEDATNKNENQNENESENKSESKPIPEVLPVPQKGLGLLTLRGVLSFFDELEGKDLSKLSIDQRREIQQRLEKDCVESAVLRWKEEQQELAKMGRSTAMTMHPLNSQLYDWQCLVEKRLQSEFDLFEVSEAREKKSMDDMERCVYAPFMRQSTPTRLAAVTIISILNSLAQQGADKGLPMTTLLNNLSKLVEEDVRYQIRNREAAARTAEYRKARQQQRAGIPSETTSGEISEPKREPDSTDEDSHIVSTNRYEVKSWPALIRSKVGAKLLSALIDCAQIKVVREHPETKMIVSQMQPALARATVHRKGRKIGVVMPNKVLVDLMKREPRGDYLARHLPMLVEPQPWSKFEKGGFLEFPSSLVRIKNGEKDQRIYAEAAFDRGDLDQVTKGLDVLGQTAWQINKPVFEVMLEAWNTGEKLANIPPLDPNIPIPEEPVSSDDPMARRDWLRRVKSIENEKSGLHSERCFMNFQLDIARAFRDQTFYFPHNMDFRGRAYPLPAYLHHMGADHVRGILRFAVGKELGKNGLRWLKVHLANVFGYDKASLDERETFATDHVKDIYDSATNPLTGQRWWLEAEDPWQCLAACIELKAALESPDPRTYLSHLPVHQDGTCNGLQHYAALGGDRWGAEQVNLLPSDRPADVYSAVADLVKTKIADDLATDNFLAKAVDGKITRKVVKQTVMTNVYGVTFTGAKAQVLKQLEAAYPNIQTETGIDVPVLAGYVATKIFEALSTMFRGAHDIQYWLGECAGRVCRALTPEQLDRIAAEGWGSSKKTKSGRPTKRSNRSFMEEILTQFRSTIVWTTPLRMPIAQPYRKTGNRVINTCLQDLTLQVPERSDPVNRRKQLQGFPPNFIHSLDASHMLLSALECNELGLSFAAVHDSFWTHAGDTDVMNRVLRDAFVRIHSEDVIGRLACEFEARYKGSLYLAKIPRGKDAERQISALRSTNRTGMFEELLQERERQKLLNSSDPDEVQKGLAMVTPASIYEKHSSLEPVQSNEGIDEVVLGKITSSKPEDDDDDEATSPGDRQVTDAEDLEGFQKFISMNHFEATIKQIKPHAKTAAKPRVEYTHFWLPLTFPAVPVKGDFNVEELKDSKYFFS
ncbi:DNA-directed RNA polymerase [Xylaria intraflava]|nr:DNA-directed RNA polymerase [Xylaria intraflava]